MQTCEEAPPPSESEYGKLGSLTVRRKLFAHASEDFVKLLAKRKSSTYQPTRSDAWHKIKRLMWLDEGQCVAELADEAAGGLGLACRARRKSAQ